jgi:hypothetical protein
VASSPETTAKPARAFVAPVVLFEHKGQVAKLTLPDGHRFVAMSHGEAPSMLLIDEPGQYTADVGLAFGDGRGLPVVIATVDLAHVPAWLALPADAVGKIINRTVAEAAKRRRGHVRH